MRRFSCGVVTALVLAVLPGRAADPFSVKSAKTALPKALKPAVQKLLGGDSLQLLDDKQQLLAEIWLRTEVPVKATETQIKNGLTYQDLEQTTLLGVVQIHQQLIDYRKQKIKPGVYTMRLAFQPMDGDHMGTAPFSEFVLLVPIDKDEGKATLEPEQLHKLSTRASGTGHPAVFLLFPASLKDAAKPRVSKQMDTHWVLTVPLPINAEGKKGTMGLGLTFVGVSPSA